MFCSRFFVSVLLSFCCVTGILAADKGKVTVDSLPNNVKSIKIKATQLEITVGKQKYTIKYNDLDKHGFPKSDADEDDTTSTAKSAEKSSTDALKDIYIFHRGDNSISRFKIYQKRAYNRIEEGTFFKVFDYKGAQLAKDEKGVVYEPHWEIKNDFFQFLIKPEQYIAMLDKDIEGLEQENKNFVKKQKELAALIKTYQKKYDKLEDATKETSTYYYDKDGNYIGRKGTKQELTSDGIHLKNDIARYLKKLQRDDDELKAKLNANTKRIEALQEEKEAIQQKLKVIAENSK